MAAPPSIWHDDIATTNDTGEQQMGKLGDSLERAVQGAFTRPVP